MLTNVGEIDQLTTNILKGIALLAVIGLHLLSTFPRKFYLVTPQAYFFIVFNQCQRFSVPFFVLLSGYGLSKKYHRSSFSSIRFILYQMTKLIPLYLLWSTYLSFLSLFLDQKGVVFAQNSWWSVVFLGQADYHLYFVPLILQLYLVFILIKKNWTEIGKKGVSILVGFQLLIYLFFSLFSRAPSDQLQYSSLFVWIGYFILGIWLAEHKKFFKPKINFILLVLGIILSTIYSFFNIDKTNNIIQSNRFTKVSIFIYSIGWIGLLLHKAKQLKSNLSFLSKIGRNSYLIFLAHTVPLYLVKEQLELSLFVEIMASYVVMILISIQIIKTFRLEVSGI